MHKLRLVLPILFALIILAGQASPVLAPAPPTATIAVEPHVTDVEVGDFFEVQVWIRDVHPDPMVAFQFSITWDRTLMRFNGHSVNLGPDTAGWDTHVDGGVYGITNDPGGNTGFFVLEGDYDEGGNPISADRLWETLTFECLGPGSAPLNLPDRVWTSDGTASYRTFVVGESFEDYVVVTVKGAVNQLVPVPVGGVVIPADTFAIVAPWLVIIGLVGCIVTAVVVAKKRQS